MPKVTLKVLRDFANFWWGDRGLSAFLLFLFVTLFIGPFLHSTLLSWLTALLFSLLLVSGVAYISTRRSWRLLAGAVALAAIILWGLREIYPTTAIFAISKLVTLLFLSCLTLVLAVRVFGGKGEVTADRVRGAIALYLLFGVVWSVLYQLLAALLSGSFSLAGGMGTTLGERDGDLTYFSFVTLTTLGYGDITPVHPLARMFVVLEALVGQLYPATLLARLVSLEITARQKPEREEISPRYETGGDGGVS
jgi:hypothetical protein